MDSMFDGVGGARSSRKRRTQNKTTRPKDRVVEFAVENWASGIPVAYAMPCLIDNGHLLLKATA